MFWRAWQRKGASPPELSLFPNQIDAIGEIRLAFARAVGTDTRFLVNGFDLTSSARLLTDRPGVRELPLRDVQSEITVEMEGLDAEWAIDPEMGVAGHMANSGQPRNRSLPTMTYSLQRRRFLVLASVSASLAVAGCGKRAPASARLKSDARVLALGDSLTAGFGATPAESWPARLGELTGWQVVNEGVNGDTTAGALGRIEALLATGNRYDAILVGIGGNDMLRGVPPQVTRDNLAQLLRQARAHTSHVAVLATPAPAALRAVVGALSDAEFYQKVAMAEQVLLLPGVYSAMLSDAALRSDRIHANASGYAEIARQLADRLQDAGWR